MVKKSQPKAVSVKHDEPVVLGKAPPRRKAAGLGRGLGALLSESRREEPVLDSRSINRVETDERQRSGFAVIPVADINPNPDQPRQHFDQDALTELAASISQRGVIQPLIVRQHEDGYQLVAGERRWRAAQIAQVHEIPVLIRDLDDRDVMALALIENLQRQDLNPVEEARAYQRLADQEGLTQAEIAQMVDKSRSHVANIQRLLALPDAVLAMVEDGRLSMGHARALIGCDDYAEIADRACKLQLSVREVERLVRQRAQGSGGATPRRARTPRSASDDADILAVQSHIEEFLGLPVRIHADNNAQSGSVTINYRTLDQLDLVCQRLAGEGI